MTSNQTRTKIGNIVTNLQPKFNYDQLRNGKVLVLCKSDNNNNMINNDVRSSWGPVPWGPVAGPKM